jgi:hypothetical protein
MSLLDITAIGLQIILPLSLIARLAFALTKSRLGFSSIRFQPASSSPVYFWSPPGQATRTAHPALLRMWEKPQRGCCAMVYRIAEPSALERV